MHPATDIFVDSLHPAAKREHELGAYLHPQSPHPWPEVTTETMLSRFSMDKGPVSLTQVAPLVAELTPDGDNPCRHRSASALHRHHKKCCRTADRSPGWPDDICRNLGRGAFSRRKPRSLHGRITANGGTKRPAHSSNCGVEAPSAMARSTTGPAHVVETMSCALVSTEGSPVALSRSGHHLTAGDARAIPLPHLFCTFERIEQHTIQILR
jgi:hypothetical protein